MFSCKVCKEKDNRIADLKEQIARLNKTLSDMTNPTYPRAVDAEADLLLNGANTFAKHMGKEDQEKLSAVEKQAIELLTGSY